MRLHCQTAGLTESLIGEGPSDIYEVIGRRLLVTDRLTS